jgi:hypothetical protein
MENMRGPAGVADIKSSVPNISIMIPRRQPGLRGDFSEV